MKITINDRVGFTPIECIMLTQHLMETKLPKDGGNDYGLETHGIFGLTTGLKLPYPIQVKQTNKRKSPGSPINITIERHRPLF